MKAGKMGSRPPEKDGEGGESGVKAGKVGSKGIGSMPPGKDGEGGISGVYASRERW